jgi:phosphoribosylformimino-5-aminoimidazole carboxamide ribotide isomerase
MRVLPAVDVREGACVQLVGGSYEAERIRLPDPAAVVASWLDRGFPMVHLVDLDAATGRGSNRDLVEAMLNRFPGVLQVGGGVRETDTVAALLAAGAARVIVGTRGAQDRRWLEATVTRFPGRIVIAADAHGRQLTTGGWSETSARTVPEIVRELSMLPLAGVFVTAVHAEGRMAGPDLGLIDAVLAATSLPVIASGGIASTADLAALAARGVAACVIGMAFYTGVLDPNTIGDEYRQ